MDDTTESMRRALVGLINSSPRTRSELESLSGGRVWDTDELRAEFAVLGFAAPLVVVQRKSDGAMGSLFFQHHPRYYFDFQEHAGQE